MSEPGKIYVGNLNFDTDDEELRIHFERYGEVEDAVVIMDRETGRSRGFGFVTFQKTKDADKVVNEIEIDEMKGRELKVNFANPKGQRSGGGGRYGGRSYGGRSYGGGSYGSGSYGSGSYGSGSYGSRSNHGKDYHNRDYSPRDRY